MDNIKLSFGTDPEFALVEPGTKNLVPPEYLIAFEGLEPIEIEENEHGVRHPIFMRTDEFSIFGDGALMEFTIKPGKSISEIYPRFRNAFEALQELADSMGLEALHSPIADFNYGRYFENMEEDLVKYSVIAGCDPDYDAINSGYQSKVRDLTGWDKRGAGGHIHVGLDYKDLHEHILPAVRLFAITAGNTFIANATDIESEKQRAEVFGKPGRYRPQTYSSGMLGVEYRTPSNSWLANEDSAMKMEQAVRKAVHYLLNPKEGIEIIDSFLVGSIEAIQTANSELANNILSEVM